MTTLQIEKRIALKNILFATDFSGVADRAMHYAGNLAKTFGAKLYALHVQEPANYALPPEVWRSADQACEEELKALDLTLVREFPGIRTEVVKGEGSVWASVAFTIEKYKIDFIVLGTHGRTGVGRLLFGSQAEEILRRTTCPVLTVGPNIAELKKPGEKFCSILYATDFGPASEAALAYAVSFAEEHQAKLTLLHVIEEPEAGELVRAPQLLEMSEQHLRSMVPEEAKFWCRPQYVVEQGAAAEEILEAAARVAADLIVLGVHELQGVPGAATHLPVATVHKILVNADCPVLTLRG